MTTKNIRNIYPTEHQIQAAIVEWANAHKVRRLGVLCAEDCTVGDLLIAIPNGGERISTEVKGKRISTEASRLKRDGVKSGVSDLFLAYISYRTGNDGKLGVFGYGLWIEVKTVKGRVTNSQKSWLDRMSHVGYDVKVVRSVDEGIQAIKDYLGME